MLWTLTILIYFICGLAALSIFERMDAVEFTVEYLASQTVLILFWPIAAVLGIIHNLME